MPDSASAGKPRKETTATIFIIAIVPTPSFKALGVDPFKFLAILEINLYYVLINSYRLEQIRRYLVSFIMFININKKDFISYMNNYIDQNQFHI